MNMQTYKTLFACRAEEIVQPTPEQIEADEQDYIWMETLYAINARQLSCLARDHRARHIRNATIGLFGDELWNVICF